MARGGAAHSTGRRVPAGGSARRAELLAIAAGMFATRGYATTTVRDIADSAGILSGSLYHHFPSKEAMLTEILHEFLDSLQARFAAIVGSVDDPRERLDGLVRASFDTIHHSPHAVALYQNEASFLIADPEFAFVGKASRVVEKTWLQVLRDGQQAGVFRGDLDLDLAHRFIRDTVWASVRWYRPSGRLSHSVVAEQYLMTLHGGLLARPEAGPAS